MKPLHGGDNGADTRVGSRARGVAQYPGDLKIPNRTYDPVYDMNYDRPATRVNLP